MNLLSEHKVSVEEKFLIEKAVTKRIKVKKIRDLRQEVTEVFWSTSMLKSQNSSSFDVTVSQFRHRVSLVRIPCV